MNYNQLFLKKGKKLSEKLLKFIITKRFSALAVGSLIGIGLFSLFAEYLKTDLTGWFDPATNSNFIGSFQLILLGLPVFILLWYFRTYDTKTQIEKSEEQIKKSAEQIEKSEKQSKKQIEKSEKQINQASYFKGLDNLTSNDQFKIEVGVNQLLDLTKLPDYTEKIKLSFIKRLKIPIEKSPQTKYTYAHYIVTWLSENFATESLNLVGCNFDYQEFLSKTNFLILKNKINKIGKLSFKEADLGGVNLSYANLEGAYLRGANLSYADLSKADLRKAKLGTANLSRANFSNAKLAGADLRGANLSRADLRGANSSDADLS